MRYFIFISSLLLHFALFAQPQYTASSAAGSLTFRPEGMPPADAGRLKLQVFSATSAEGNLVFAEDKLVIKLENPSSHRIETTKQSIKVQFKIESSTPPTGVELVQNQRTKFTVQKRILKGEENIENIADGIVNTNNLLNEYIFTATVNLEPGNNEIKIIAKNSNPTNNVLHSNVLRVNYTIDAYTYHALIIGNSAYSRGLITLPNTVKDADTLMNLLTNSYGFNTNNITYLPNGSKTEIEQRIRFVCNKMTNTDNLLVFYAGHGKTGAWIGTDGQEIENQFIIENIINCNAANTLLIADACFSGSLLQTNNLKRERIPDFIFGSDDPTTVWRKAHDGSKSVMTSSTNTTVSDESHFFKLLSQILKENKKKYLPASHIFMLLETDVIQKTGNFPRHQPINSGISGDFIFIRK